MHRMNTRLYISSLIKNLEIISQKKFKLYISGLIKNLEIISQEKNSSLILKSFRDKIYL